MTLKVTIYFIEDHPENHCLTFHKTRYFNNILHGKLKLFHIELSAEKNRVSQHQNSTPYFLLVI